MQLIAILLVLYLIVALVVVPIWAFIKISSQSKDHEALRNRVAELEVEMQSLRSGLRNQPATPAVPAVNTATAELVTPPPTAFASINPPLPPVVATAAAAAPARPETNTGPAIPVVTPPPDKLFAPIAPPPSGPPELPPVFATAATPAPARPVYTPPPPAPSWTDTINWEQFMGAKLFAWLGGLALFLGVAFFVKYSFEHDLIPPAMRVAIGFVTGAGLIVGGLAIPRARYAITAQTLIAAGVVSLYAVTFACRSIYHFEFFGAVPTFLLMTLITATAFVLAVRLHAQVVAILGILGGFLTPLLIGTGRDNPPGLFGYIALLDAGLIAVVLRTGWRYLVPVSAGGTVLLLLGWSDKFFAAEKGPVAMAVCLGFSALYLAAAELARRRNHSGPEFSWTAATLPFVGLAFGVFFLGYESLAARAPLYFGYVLLLDALLLTLAWRDDSMPRLHLAAGFAVFALLSLWTAHHLTDALLPWALGTYLVFAALHTVFPLLWQRHRADAEPTWWSQLFPPLTLLLMLIPIQRIEELSFLIWPAILLVDVLAILLAVITASLTAVAAVLVLTLLATGLAIFNVRLGAPFDPSLLFVIGGFAVFFFAGSFWIARKLGLAASTAADGRDKFSALFGDARTQIPAFSSLLPFVLLVMVCARLHVPDPSAVFGLGLLLVVLTLGLTRLMAIAWLPACALAGMAAVQYAWHVRHFDSNAPTSALAWHLGFYAIFAAFPFLFRLRFSRLTGPWAVAAASGLAHFWFVYRALKPGWPADLLGALPALFALAPLASLGAVLKTVAADNPKRLNQLGWFGGVALFFITLIFPIQFERQWLTVAWALEGAALLWLFHRVPHPGLRATGAVLLVIAFARLALNPAVLGYHVRGDTAIFNWYLYAYGLAAAALFVGARLAAPPRERALGVNLPPLLNALGVILAFLLLNIEIADYFTAPGARAPAFQFSGNFARDMSYTIGWALFALGLLGAGIWQKSRVARFAALGLLGAALLKLFFHDLARLEALYRIGALFAVAIIAILASFAYQRFLPSNDKTPPPQP